MAEDQIGGESEISKQFLQHLENTGFFQQIRDLEGSLTTIAGELQKFGQSAAQRMEETENLAAHVLAIESILSVMIRKAGLDEAEVLEEVKHRTAALSSNPEGSPAVIQIATDMLKGSEPVN